MFAGQSITGTGNCSVTPSFGADDVGIAAEIAACGVTASGQTAGAITGSWIAPIWGLGGVAFSAAWVPTQNMVCLGLGAGATVGHSLSGGPVVVHAYEGQTVKDVLGGPSLSGGYNYSVFKGAQGSVNSSGFSAGYSIGIPGVSGAATFSWCHTF